MQRCSEWKAVSLNCGLRRLVLRQSRLELRALSDPLIVIDLAVAVVEIEASNGNEQVVGRHGARYADARFGAQELGDVEVGLGYLDAFGPLGERERERRRWRFIGGGARRGPAPDVGLLADVDDRVRVDDVRSLVTLKHEHVVPLNHDCARIGSRVPDSLFYLD